MCARLLKIYRGSHYFELGPAKREDRSSMLLENAGSRPVYFQFRTVEAQGVVNCSGIGCVGAGDTATVNLLCIAEDGGGDGQNLGDEEAVSFNVRLFAWNLTGARDPDGKEVPEERDLDCHVYFEAGLVNKNAFTMNIYVEGLNLC